MEKTFRIKSELNVHFISGAGVPAMFWTDGFCEKLLNAGYAIIRFGHRDQGLSDAVDWKKNPYTITEDFYIRSKHPVGVAWHHIWCLIILI